MIGGNSFCSFLFKSLVD